MTPRPLVLKQVNGHLGPAYLDKSCFIVEQVYCTLQGHPAGIPGKIRVLCASKCAWAWRHKACMYSDPAFLFPTTSCQSQQPLQHLLWTTGSTEAVVYSKWTWIGLCCRWSASAMYSHTIPTQGLAASGFSVYRKILLCFACTALGTLAWSWWLLIVQWCSLCYFPLLSNPIISLLPVTTWMGK